MLDDPIVEETRRLRDEYASQFDYDLEAICRDLVRRQAKHPERVVSFADTEQESPRKRRAS